MVLLGLVKTTEGLDADKNRPAGFRCQQADSGFGDLFLGFIQIVDSQRVGMPTVDKLTAAVKGIHTIEENIHNMLTRKSAMADKLLSGGLEKLLLHLSPQELLAAVGATPQDE